MAIIKKILIKNQIRQNKNTIRTILTERGLKTLKNIADKGTKGRNTIAFHITIVTAIGNEYLVLKKSEMNLIKSDVTKRIIIIIIRDEIMKRAGSQELKAMNFLRRSFLMKYVRKKSNFSS